MIEQRFVERLAGEVGAGPEQVEAAIKLFDRGSTVPFVARYRKDVTGNLDEVKLEQIEERNAYYTALISRRNAVLDNIEKQGKLTEELRSRIEAAVDQTTLEDLYLPYKKQRRTKASIAIEQGLEPLADFLWDQKPGLAPLEEYAQAFMNAEKRVSSPEEAIEGARNILAERISMDADVRSRLREVMQAEGVFKSTATKLASDQKTKFESYYEHSEPLKAIPSHRLLAILRGERQGLLRTDLLLNDDRITEELAQRCVKEPGSQYEPHIQATVQDAYKRLLRPSIENEVVGLARQAAEEEAIRVFRENARNLLLSSPAGRLVVMGVDPGIRTGCKLAIIDNVGTFLENATIYPLEPQKDEAGAEALVRGLLQKHQVQALAVGNGTGSREVAHFLEGVLKRYEHGRPILVFVNEAGASVYSASKLARQEFPDLDVTVRGAISIARRLQDPLAELVKIEPRSVGVGQYQHDVNQRRLREGLYKTVESCVNLVGVDLNTASVELLRYISGIQMGTAQNIIAFRTEHGGFKSRAQLLEVSGIGERTFEQAAGFMRILGAENPLDATSIHPEAYRVVEQMAESLGVGVKELIANPALLDKINLETFANAQVGRLTLGDVRQELMKPGRDPRREFRVPKFIEGVADVKHLEEGMEAEGVVTNVTDFGAFVDIGVHQDGLVHLSELANRFVRDPREVVKVGDIVRVRVVKVDKEMSRISLSMKAAEAAPPRPVRHERTHAPDHGRPEPRRAPAAAGQAERGERPARRKDKGRKPKPDQRPVKQMPPAEQFNTVLADQLAALKKKFGS